MTRPSAGNERNRAPAIGDQGSFTPSGDRDSRISAGSPHKQGGCLLRSPPSGPSPLTTMGRRPRPRPSLGEHRTSPKRRSPRPTGWHNRRLGYLCVNQPGAEGLHPPLVNRLQTFGGWQARPSRLGEPYLPGTIIWTTPDGVDHDSPPPCLPGTALWNSPLPFPALLTQTFPKAEKPGRQDLMPSAERTVRRTRRWTADLAWHANRQDRLRRALIQRRAEAAAKKQGPVPRPPSAPWGQGTGQVPGYAEPPF
jgi:hypothetical protein